MNDRILKIGTLLPALLVTVAHAPVRAQVVATPADAGTIVTPAGNTLTITGGTPAGSNLFHSFQQFGLTAAQTANFLANPTIQNILARVTGGQASIIDGRIQVTGSNANLYLMNPAGIVFGATASLNVPGSFIATTANGIGIGDRWFNAAGTNDYANLIGTPGTLAFTMAQPGAIVNSAFLEVGAGSDLVLAAGTVANTNFLSAPSGRVVVASVPGNNLVRISAPGSPLSLEIAPPAGGSSLPTNWALPILSLPQLLTGGGGSSASGIEVVGGQVRLTGSALPVETGDVSMNAVAAQTAIVSSDRNLTVAGAFSNLTTTGDLHLLARNTALIQDTATAETTVQVGGSLRIQGNQGINLQLLNSNESLIQTVGNLALVSDGTVTSNAQFVTGGNFDVLTQAGTPGTFVYAYNVGAPNRQGIISANGNVTFGSYTGPSLKIEARGSITGGNITINDTNPTLRGTDPDIGILASTRSLVLRAGVTTLRNPVNTGQLSGTSFADDNTPSTPGNITVGTITTAPTIAEDPNGAGVFGSVILSATGNIQVNGDIRAGDFYPGGGGIGNKGGPVVLSAPQGTITVTGNITGSSVSLASQGDINTGAVTALYDAFRTNNAISLFSRNGGAIVEYLRAPFGDVDVNVAGVFQVRDTFATNFTNTDFPNAPISIQAGGNNRITIRHGGSDFIHAIGLERNAAGDVVFRNQVTGNQVFLSGSGVLTRFVDQNNNVVNDPVIAQFVPFDPNALPLTLSYTRGLMIQKGGVDAQLYGTFQNSPLITVDRVVPPTTTPPTNPGSTPPNTPNSPNSPGNVPPDSGREGANVENGETVQRQLSQPSSATSCDATNTSPSPTTDGTDTRSPTDTSTRTPCNTTGDNAQILRILND